MYYETAEKLLEFIRKKSNCFFMQWIQWKKHWPAMAFRSFPKKNCGAWPPAEIIWLQETIQRWSLFPFRKKRRTAFTLWQVTATLHAFKIKENPEVTVDNKYVKLNVERYGRYDLCSLVWPSAFRSRPCNCQRRRKAGDKAGWRRQRFTDDSKSCHSHEQRSKWRIQIQCTEGFTSVIRWYCCKR